MKLMVNKEIVFLSLLTVVTTAQSDLAMVGTGYDNNAYVEKQAELTFAPN